MVTPWIKMNPWIMIWWRKGADLLARSIPSDKNLETLIHWFIWNLSLFISPLLFFCHSLLIHLILDHLHLLVAQLFCFFVLLFHLFVLFLNLLSNYILLSVSFLVFKVAVVVLDAFCTVDFRLLLLWGFNHFFAIFLFNYFFILFKLFIVFEFLMHAIGHPHRALWAVEVIVMLVGRPNILLCVLI